MLVPLWQAHAEAPRAEWAAFGVAILLYLVAKLAELNDHALYAYLGVVSGHTAKQVLATMSSAVLVAQLAWREPRQSALQPQMASAPIHSWGAKPY